MNSPKWVPFHECLDDLYYFIDGVRNELQAGVKSIEVLAARVRSFAASSAALSEEAALRDLAVPPNGQQ